MRSWILFGLVTVQKNRPDIQTEGEDVSFYMRETYMMLVFPPYLFSFRCHTDQRCQGTPLRQAEGGCDQQSFWAAGHRPGLHRLQGLGGSEATGQRGRSHGLHR